MLAHSDQPDTQKASKSKQTIAALLIAMAFGSSAFFINVSDGPTTGVLVALGFPGYFISAMVTNIHDPTLWLAALVNAVVYFYLSRAVWSGVAKIHK